MNSKILFSLLFCFVFWSCGISDSKNEKLIFLNLDRIVTDMEAELSKLNDEIILLKNHYDFLLKNRDSISQVAKIEPYTFLDGYSTNTPGGDSTLSSIVILDNPYSYDAAIQEVKLTNSLDSLFRQIKSRYSFVAQVYSNSSNQISRVFPAYDAKALISKDADLTHYNFFYEGIEENNPSKTAVWIPDAYVDPAGRGWILSLIHPVYDGEKLFSVIGIDITVDQIIERYLNTEEEHLVIATKDGDIVAASTSAIEALSFPPLRNYIYKDIILLDNFRISDYNLFNSKNQEVRKMADELLLKNKSFFEFSEEFSPKSAQMVYFNLLDWVLIEIKLNEG